MAIASSEHTRPYSGKTTESLTLIARSLLPARHSTPGSGLHYDNFTRSQFPGARNAPPQPGLHTGVRLLITLECANVTHIVDQQGGWEYKVQAPCAGAGVAMPVELRGYLEGEPTRYLHMGGSHFIDDTPLPARLQLVMDFSVFDEPKWNAAMDAFRLKDMVEAMGTDEYKLSGPEFEAMIARLVNARVSGDHP